MDTKFKIGDQVRHVLDKGTTMPFYFHNDKEKKDTLYFTEGLVISVYTETCPGGQQVHCAVRWSHIRAETTLAITADLQKINEIELVLASEEGKVAV